MNKFNIGTRAPNNTSKYKKGLTSLPLKSKNVLIFYNLNSNQKKVVEELIERFGIKQRYDLTFND